ncbi:ribose 1,5-bisphosphate isomerase [Candidatus Woesearchaeota archaeon]|nr:MAG: ribose 1,5-bisphosphate isomerase [Candidatus Woesearchaeota archaeon]
MVLFNKNRTPKNMRTPYKKIIKDIKTLRIQGAENVALAGLKVLEKAIKLKLSEKEILVTIKDILTSRPTEPMLKNCLNYVLSKPDTIEEIRKIRSHIKESREKIIAFGVQKIPDKSTVYTHCHSSTVTAILKHAKANGKKIEVHNTETRPTLQGRITARELSKAGIPVKHYIDSAARIALKKADIALIGADAITSETKVINKIGSELIAEAAKKLDVPLYCCTNSWKFDPNTIYGKETMIELRPAKEIWSSPPKKVQIFNFAFERVSPELITAIISELGVYRPQLFVSEFKRTYPELL